MSLARRIAVKGLRQTARLKGQATVEYMVLAGIVFLVGTFFHRLSTPFAAALFYGGEAEPMSNGKVLVNNAGLERAIARPYP
jgi:hypothetical protein